MGRATWISNSVFLVPAGSALIAQVNGRSMCLPANSADSVIACRGH